MNKSILVYISFFLISGCSSKNKYDVARYYDVQEQDRVLTGIITFLFSAPTYISMKDRFKPEHRNYYSSLTGRVSIEKYFIADDGTHYFYILRPASNTNEKRGVGGRFRMNDDFKLTEFREIYVTPILPEEELKGRCAFLFDEMVKGTIGQYLVMESYVQWPNPVSYYDSVTYEWKLKPGMEPLK